jgi:hypothetical protein
VAKVQRLLPTPSANLLPKINKCNFDRVLNAPHFTPRLTFAVFNLDSFEKTGTFNRIDAIRFLKRPFRPPLDRIR